MASKGYIEDYLTKRKIENTPEGPNSEVQQKS